MPDSNLWNAWDPTSSLCLSFLSWTHLHGFFAFNTRRKTYCARFHQALTREGEIPPFLALLSSDFLFIWDVETSVFCTWVFPPCAGRCHCPGRSICPSHRGSTDTRESEKSSLKQCQGWPDLQLSGLSQWNSGRAWEHVEELSKQDGSAQPWPLRKLSCSPKTYY